MALTLNEWFCMKGERSSFMPQIPGDAALVFCHDHVIHEDVLNSIEMRFATKKPIKMLIHGDWGVGKTHLTYHMCWWLQEHASDYPAHPVIIEIGDISRKSRFDEIVRPFLDKLGIDFLIKLVHDYRGVHPNVEQALRDADVGANVAAAVNKVLLSSPGAAPVPLVLQAFEYLKGRKVSGSDAGLSQPLEESREFYEVLLALGTMYRSVHGKLLLFIADEAARLERVESDEATQQHWVNANKLIFDDNANLTFGFVYTVSGKQADLPQAVFEPQIQNRLGQNIFGLATLATTDVENYLTKLTDAFIDQARVEELVAAGTIPKADYTWDAYPFTAEARSEFVDYYNRTQQDAKPRDISNKLDELAFFAGKRDKRLIDAECLKARNM